MDLFGKKTQKELEQLQLKMRNLESRYNCMAAMHSKVNEELRVSTVQVTSINDAKKSIALHEDEKRDHDQKADEYARKSKEIASKEAELLEVHDNKKASLTKETREFEEKNRAIKADLSDSEKRAKALEKEIQSGESKRDSVAAEIEQLEAGRSNAETSLIETQEKWFKLSCVVDKLTSQQEALASSNLYLNQVVSHFNRHGDEDTVFASLEHDLHRFLIHDRASGAVQVELKARPLLLVVDLGYDSLNFAAVRAGLVSGDSEISLLFESRKIEQGMGCSRFETLLAGWVWERFTAIHPRLNKSVKEQKGIELSLPVARRLLALLCQGAPQGEVEETIVIDSEPFSASIPLQREELVSVFLPLLGPDGELTRVIRRFIAEFKLSMGAIDRIVCMGWYGRLPLLRESLGEVFKRPVLIAEQLLTIAPSESHVMQDRSQETPADEMLHMSTNIVRSDPERKKREKELQEKEESERVERVKQARIEMYRREQEQRRKNERDELERREAEHRQNLVKNVVDMDIWSCRKCGGRFEFDLFELTVDCSDYGGETASCPRCGKELEGRGVGIKLISEKPSAILYTSSKDRSNFNIKPVKIYIDKSKYLCVKCKKNFVGAFAYSDRDDTNCCPYCKHAQIQCVKNEQFYSVIIEREKFVKCIKAQNSIYG